MLILPLPQLDNASLDAVLQLAFPRSKAYFHYSDWAELRRLTHMHRECQGPRGHETLEYHGIRLIPHSQVQPCTLEFFNGDKIVALAEWTHAKALKTAREQLSQAQQEIDRLTA